MKGSYLLLMEVKYGSRHRIGSLGIVHFLPGTYVYVGSALGSLEGRVLRHFRRRKRIRWHIDYLTSSQETAITGVFLIHSAARLECRLSTLISQLPVMEPVPGFGCSDCKSGCKSHLYFAVSDRNGVLRSLRETVEQVQQG